METHDYGTDVEGGSVIGQFRVNPWVRGFQPLGTKCPRCKRIGTLFFTGRYAENGDHVYKCVSCGATVGSPTDWAYCNRFGEFERIEKDTFFSPCIKCKFRSPIPSGRPGGGVCRYFKVRAPEDFL